MKNLHWHLKLRVSPGLKEPEEIEGFNFEIFNGNTYVNIYFHTTSFDQKLPSQLYEYEYAEETLTREFLEKLRILLLKRFIFRKAFESIEIAVEECPTLLNKEELK